MKLRAALIILGFLLFGFVGECQDWKQYPYVPEGGVFSFPADEGHHPDEEIEWWYIAGHLKGLETGTNYSFMYTYFAYPVYGFEGFRILNLSNDDTGEFYDETQPLMFLELGLDSMNIQAILLSGTNEYWTHKKDTADQLIPFEYDISAQGEYGSINLSCVSQKPPIYLGDSGLFNQGDSSYTYYYSQTMNSISGTLSFKDVEEEVTGTAWIDRQFGAFNQVTDERYEWFYVQLSNGMDMNIWNVFTGDNQLPDTSTFKHITVSDENASHYTTTDFELERLAFNYMPDSMMCYSQKWRLTSPVNQLDLIMTTLHNNSEVELPFRFFEGSTHVSGTVNGDSVTGKGFAELLRNYEKPAVRMNEPEDTIWDGTAPISWHLSNPDDGRPLLYDLEYSTDQFATHQSVQTGLSDTLYDWNNPPLEMGDTCWFRIKGYSIDTTLYSYSDISKPFIYLIESNSVIPHKLNTGTLSPFILFPNPAKGIIHLRFKQEEPSFSYRIQDLTGRVLSESPHISQASTTYISIENLPAGSYIIRVFLDSGVYPSMFQVVE